MIPLLNDELIINDGKPRASGDDPNYDRFLYADTE